MGAATAGMMKTAAKNECAVWVQRLQYTGWAIVSGLFISPAIILNLLSMEARGNAWVFMSIVLVMGGAWLAHEARSRREFLIGLIAISVVGISMATAVRNIGGMRKADEQTRNDAAEAKGTVKENRAQLVKQRKAQADMSGVGETLVDAFMRQIEKEKDNPYYKSSKGCTDVTAYVSHVLCDKINDLDLKRKASEARDGFDRQIYDIDHPKEAQKVPLPTSDNAALIRMAGWFGFDKTQSADVDQNYEIVLVLAYELLAAMIPGIAFRTIMGDAKPVPVVQEHEPETRTSNTPSPPRKTRTASRGPKSAGPVQGGATVINMDRSKVVQPGRFKDISERAKVVQQFSGLSQRKIAGQLGWSKTMVQRALAFSASQKDHLEPQRMAS